MNVTGNSSLVNMTTIVEQAASSKQQVGSATSSSLYAVEARDSLLVVLPDFKLLSHSGAAATASYRYTDSKACSYWRALSSVNNSVIVTTNGSSNVPFTCDPIYGLSWS